MKADGCHGKGKESSAGYCTGGWLFQPGSNTHRFSSQLIGLSSSHMALPHVRVQSCHVPRQGRAGNILWAAQNDDPDVNRLLQSTAHLNPVIINNANMKRHIHFKKHQRENSDAFSYSSTCLLSVFFKGSRTNPLKANIFQAPWLFFFFSQPVSHPASSF